MDIRLLNFLLVLLVLICNVVIVSTAKNIKDACRRKDNEGVKKLVDRISAAVYISVVSVALLHVVRRYYLNYFADVGSDVTVFTTAIVAVSFAWLHFVRESEKQGDYPSVERCAGALGVLAFISSIFMIVATLLFYLSQTARPDKKQVSLYFTPPKYLSKGERSPSFDADKFAETFSRKLSPSPRS